MNWLFKAIQPVSNVKQLKHPNIVQSTPDNYEGIAYTEYNCGYNTVNAFVLNNTCTALGNEFPNFSAS